MQKPRQYPKTVLLPNGLVLIVGGEGNGEDHPGEKSSEIFDPSDETFVVGSLLPMDPDDDTKNRRYHSEAFLLPDGRVITAGDDTEGEGIDPEANGATYNVYYPTYWSQARPTIVSTSETTIAWSNYFDVCASGLGEDGEDFDSVILVRPSSTTHSIDFDHRQVQLHAEVQEPASPCQETRIRVTLPELGSGDWKKHVLPPGYYMLIVRKYDGEGNPPIPSAAKFVELQKP